MSHKEACLSRIPVRVENPWQSLCIKDSLPGRSLSHEKWEAEISSQDAEVMANNKPAIKSMAICSLGGSCSWPVKDDEE